MARHRAIYVDDAVRNVSVQGNLVGYEGGGHMYSCVAYVCAGTKAHSFGCLVEQPPGCRG